MSKEATAQHALSPGGFPQLRILHNVNQVNPEGLPYASFGILDNLGNTEWTEVTIRDLFTLFLETGLIVAFDEEANASAERG